MDASNREASKDYLAIHYKHRSNWLCAAVLGTNDGILSTGTQSNCYATIMYWLFVLLNITDSFSQAPRETDYADVNGIRIYYEIYGQGKPLVLLQAIEEPYLSSSL